MIKTQNIHASWRIWRFSRSAVIPVIVILVRYSVKALWLSSDTFSLQISLMQFAAGIAAGIKSQQVGKFSLCAFSSVFISQLVKLTFIHAVNEANFSRTSVCSVLCFVSTILCFYMSRCGLLEQLSATWLSLHPWRTTCGRPILTQESSRPGLLLTSWFNSLVATHYEFLLDSIDKCILNQLKLAPSVLHLRLLRSSHSSH